MRRAKQTGRYGDKDSWKNAKIVSKHFGCSVIFAKKLIKYFFLSKKFDDWKQYSFLEDLWYIVSGNIQIERHPNDDDIPSYSFRNENEVKIFIEGLPNVKKTKTK